MSSETANPVFIGGLNRSGTSLMRALVGSHSQVAMPPSEFGFFEQFAPGRSATFDDATLGRAVTEVLGWPKVATWHLDARRVRELADAERSSRGVFVAVLQTYAEQHRRRRFGSKDTNLERHLATLDSWFPSGYGFVQMVRHPVPAYASQRFYAGTEHQVDPYAWSVSWLRSVAIAIGAIRRRKRQYALARYEDLVRSPEDQLHRICRALDLGYEPAMLEMADFEAKENSSFTPQTADYVGGIRRRDSVDRASLLGGDELRVVRHACRASARLLGYDVDDDSAVALPPRSAAIDIRVRARVALLQGQVASAVHRALPRR